MFVCCECCVLSGRGLCDELITHPEESYRLCCVAVCDLENLKNEEVMTRVGSQRHGKKGKHYKTKRRWKKRIKINQKETGLEGVKGTNLVRDRDQWHPPINRGSIKWKEFFNRRVTVSLSMTLLHITRYAKISVINNS